MLLSNPKHLEVIYSMCKKVWMERRGEDPLPDDDDDG